MRIYNVMLAMVRLATGLAREVQQHDPDLARQLKRASASVVLNFQEGLYSRAGNRIARFHDAMGSARETMACLHVAVAAGYVTQTQVALCLEHADHAVAVLFKLARKPRA